MPEAQPYEFSARLSVALDVKSPQAFLALGPTFELADELGLAIDWLPLERSAMTSPPAESDDRGTQHRRSRALYHEADLQRYAKARGLVIRNVHRSGDSSVAGTGLLVAKAHEQARAYLERVFARYWDETLDIEDAGAIEALLKECGVPDADLSLSSSDASGSSAYRAEYAALQASLAATGLFTTPAYLLEGEVYYGRAHLPMIRWILRGRTGPPPI